MISAVMGLSYSICTICGGGGGKQRRIMVAERHGMIKLHTKIARLSVS